MQMLLTANEACHAMSSHRYTLAYSVAECRGFVAVALINARIHVGHNEGRIELGTMWLLLSASCRWLGGRERRNEADGRISMPSSSVIFT